MKSNYFIVPFLIVLMSSCNITISDIAQEQGTEGVEEICLLHGDTESWVRTGSPSLQRLCKGRFFHYHNNNDIVCTQFVMESGTNYGTIISGHITESVKDSIFLLADRKPLDSIFGPLQTLPCPFDTSSTTLGRPKDPMTNDHDFWDMIEKSKYHDFWILNINTSDVYGPFTFDEYLAKKKELGVPENLKLNCE